jgi:putative aldouronate transport system substrate-binding protein
MKTSLKPFALLLSLILVFGLFTGCNNSTGTTPSATPAPSDSETQTQAPVESAAPGLPYPQLTEEPATLTVWQIFTADYIASMNDSDFVTELAKRTNVTLKFQEASTADAVTSFNLMLNSGDYTDIVRTNTTTLDYPGGPDKAIEDGVYLKLNDLIEKYAPNYSAKRNSTPDVARQTITDAGNMWSMYTLAIPAEYPWMGLALRKDILDKKGIALPVTLTDWETALQAYVDEGVKYPLLMDVTGTSLNGEFLSAWNVGKEFYQNNGKVMYGYIQPEFKEYLTMMNEWYNKGFLDKEFTSHGVTFDIFAGDAFTFILNGEAGAGLFPWGYTDVSLSVRGQAKIEGFNLAAVSAPKMNAGDTINFRFTSSEAKSPNAITSACANPELAVNCLTICSPMKVRFS